MDTKLFYLILYSKVQIITLYSVQWQVLVKQK